MRVHPAVIASLLLMLLPAGLLHPALFSDRVFVPFDHRVFPPQSMALEDSELQDLRASGNFDITDKTIHNLPQIRFAGMEVARGRFPSWDPYACIGAPLFAGSPSALAHPLFIQHLLMDPLRAFAVTTWIEMALAGLIMLALLRELRASWRAATFGAIVFAWAGTMTARLHLFQHYSVLLWLPAMLWAVTRIHRGGGLRAMFALAIATAMAWTSGHAPAAITTSLTVGVWFLCSSVRADRRAFCLGLCGFALGLALAACVIAPLAAYVFESGRDTDDLLLATRRARELDPAAWLNFFLQSPFSTLALNHAGGVPHEMSPLLWLLHSRAGDAGMEPVLNATEHRVYLGALPILLVPFGIGRGKRRTGLFAVFAATVLLVLATGRAPYDWLVTVLPPVGLLKPMELFPPVACLLAITATLGFDRVFVSTRSAAQLWLLTVSAVFMVTCVGAAWYLASLGDPTGAFLDAMESRWGDAFRAVGRERVRELFGPSIEPALQLLLNNLWHGTLLFGAVAVSVIVLRRNLRAGAFLAIALTAVELIWCATPANRLHLPPTATTPVHEFMRHERDLYANRGGFAVARVAAASADTGIAYPEVPTGLPPGSFQPERIRDMNSYALHDGRSHLVFRKLYGDSPVPITLLARSLRAFPDDTRLEHPLFDLFGVRFMLCWAPEGRRLLKYAGKPAMKPLVGRRGTFYVHERPNPCPRAFVVARAETLEDDAAVLEALVAPEFDPRALVYLNRSTMDTGLGYEPKPDPAHVGGGTVRFDLDEASHVILKIEDCGGGYLVMSDAAMAGWSVRVNGQPAKMYQGDFCLRAVPVPQGKVTVEFRYRPPLLLLGISITLCALLTGIFVILVSYRRRSFRSTAPNGVSCE